VAGPGVLPRHRRLPGDLLEDYLKFFGLNYNI
jgi:hypothetical protein